MTDNKIWTDTDGTSEVHAVSSVFKQTPPSLRARYTDVAAFLINRMRTSEAPQQVHKDLYEVERSRGIFSSGDATFLSDGSMSTVEALLGLKRPTLFALNENIFSKRSVSAAFRKTLTELMPDELGRAHELSPGATQIFHSFLAEFSSDNSDVPNASFFDANAKINYRPDPHDTEALRMLAVFCTQMLGMAVGVCNPLVPKTSWGSSGECNSVDLTSVDRPEESASRFPVAGNGIFDLPLAYCHDITKTVMVGDNLETEGQIAPVDSCSSYGKDDTSDNDLEVMFGEQEQALQELRPNDTAVRIFPLVQDSDLHDSALLREAVVANAVYMVPKVPSSEACLCLNYLLYALELAQNDWCQAMANQTPVKNFQTKHSVLSERSEFFGKRLVLIARNPFVLSTLLAIKVGARCFVGRSRSLIYCQLVARKAVFNMANRVVGQVLAYGESVPSALSSLQFFDQLEFSLPAQSDFKMGRDVLQRIASIMKGASMYDNLSRLRVYLTNQYGVGHDLPTLMAISGVDRMSPFAKNSPVMEKSKFLPPYQVWTWPILKALDRMDTLELLKGYQPPAYGAVILPTRIGRTEAGSPELMERLTQAYDEFIEKRESDVRLATAQGNPRAEQEISKVFTFAFFPPVMGVKEYMAYPVVIFANANKGELLRSHRLITSRLDMNSRTVIRGSISELSRFTLQASLLSISCES
eukprot:GHVP01054849.1.p1 GENE.GHVP01054849.1~~GHVP01054849.1.p1  ORF type:complete len:714 (-),score=51.79 GHVP01054849.1:163-2256(-)